MSALSKKHQNIRKQNYL